MLLCLKTKKNLLLFSSMANIELSAPQSWRELTQEQQLVYVLGEALRKICYLYDRKMVQTCL